jgi:two-component sensor histidine kinase
MKRFIAIFLFIYIAAVSVAAQHIVDPILATLTTDKEKADTLFFFAMKYFRRAKFDSADYFFKKGVVFAEKNGDDELLARYNITHGNVFLVEGQFTKGLELLNRGYTYLSRISSYELHNKYLLMRGMCMEKINKSDSALFYYHQCELLNNRENPYRNWLVYCQTALLFQVADAFEEAEKYFKKAYQITKAKSIRSDHVVVVSQFAGLYYHWGKSDEFALLMNEQQDMINAGKRDFTKDPIHSMFFINWDEKAFEKKVTFMQAVKNELQRRRSPVNAAFANNYIASFYEKANQPDSALKYIRENQRLFEQDKDFGNLYTNTRIAYNLLKKAGREEAAIAEADKLFSLKDSIIKLQQRETVLELETRYESEKKERDIALLSTENRLNSLRLSKEMEIKKALLRQNELKDSVVIREKEYNKLLGNENDLRRSQLENEQALKAAIQQADTLKGDQLVKEKKIRWQLLSGSFLLLLCGVMIFFLYRKQRMKNRVIQKQSDDLQVLMKEIHHRVKNNLQVISSLLDLQSLSIKDKQAAGAVREGKIRVQSMALIHQNLYSEGNIKGIVMEDYIKSLVENLFNSYNIQENKIRLVTDIDHLNLDVDTVIPLGLIVNELISNSLKYAFRGKEQGEIYVTLKEQEQQLQLKVKDNGCGFPANWNKTQSNSFGYNLIKAFAQKLKARLDIYNDEGACVSMSITRYKMA